VIHDEAEASRHGYPFFLTLSFGACRLGRDDVVTKLRGAKYLAALIKMSIFNAMLIQFGPLGRRQEKPSIHIRKGTAPLPVRIEQPMRQWSCS